MPQYVDKNNRIVNPHTRFESHSQQVCRIVHQVQIDAKTGKPILKDGEPVILDTLFDSKKVVPPRKISWEEIIVADKLTLAATPEEEARNLRHAADHAHKERLRTGVSWDGANYPCTEKDQRGIAKLIAAYQNHADLYSQWVEDNPLQAGEDDEAYTARMAKDNVVDPEKLQYDMSWSDGRTLAIRRSDVKKLFAAMTLYVNHSFRQRDGVV